MERRWPLAMSLLLACASPKPPVAPVPTCEETGCPEGQLCRGLGGVPVCERGGCRVRADCLDATKVCIESACVAAPASDTVQDCAIVGPARFATQGTRLEVQAAAFDADGRVVPYQSFTGGTATAPAPGPFTVSVTFDGGPSCDAPFLSLAPPATGTARVALYDPVAGTLIGASATGDVLVSDAASGALIAGAAIDLDASGTISVAVPAGVSFAVTYAGARHHPASIYGLDGGVTYDLALPLEPFDPMVPNVTTGFGGKPDFSVYDAELPSVSGTADVHVAFASPSVSLSALLGVQLSSYAGDQGELLVPDFLKRDGQAIMVPRSLYLRAFGQVLSPNGEGYATRALPGRRLAWGVGFKGRSTELLRLIPRDGTIDTPEFRKTVISLLDHVALAYDSFPRTAPQATGALTLAGGLKHYLTERAVALWQAFAEQDDLHQDPHEFNKVALTPRRRLEFTAQFENPGMQAADPAPLDNPAGQPLDRLNGVGVGILALSPTYGLVPLGVGLGADRNADGVLEPHVAGLPDSFPADRLYTRFAGPPRELADAEVVAVALATNYAELSAETDRQRSQAVRVKGIIARSGSELGWTGADLGARFDDAASASFAAFTEPKATRRFVSTAEGLTTPLIAHAQADLLVVRLYGRLGERELKWNVLVAPGAIAAGGSVLRLPERAGGNFLNGALPIDNLLRVSTIALRYRTPSRGFADHFSPATGLLETGVKDVQSFAVYSEEILGR